MVRKIPRPLARAPIQAFAAGLGGLTFGRLVMIEHRGRRTGRPHRVVLEVIARDPAGVAVVAGFGPRTDWYRNVQANPAVRVWWRWQRDRPATARPADADDTLRILEAYRSRYPRAARAFGRALDLPDLASGAALDATVILRLPVVHIRFDPPTDPFVGS